MERSLFILILITATVCYDYDYYSYCSYPLLFLLLILLPDHHLPVVDLHTTTADNNILPLTPRSS